jgi:transcriptional regulator with XRE-family HTH domain
MTYDKEKNNSIWDSFLTQPSADEYFINKQMEIAAQIDTYLKQTGWSQKTLAEKAGIRPSQLSSILAGEGNPTLRTITKLEETLGKNVIVCPEFYEEDLIEQGWFQPGTIIELSAGAYRNERVTGSNLNFQSEGWQDVDSPKVKQYSSANEYHLKPTGT